MPIKISKAAPQLSIAAYESGDVLGERIKFTHVLGGYADGYVTHVQVVDRSGSGPALLLHLMPEPFTVGDDNAPFSLDAQNLGLYHHAISIPDSAYVSLGDAVVASVSKLALPVKGVYSAIFGVLQAQSAYTPVAEDDLEVTLFVQVLE